jgi:hypothetical protein
VDDTTRFADLDGIKMKVLHKMLDMKRKKCARDNADNPDEWILSAFPIVTNTNSSENV